MTAGLCDYLLNTSYLYTSLTNYYMFFTICVNQATQLRKIFLGLNMAETPPLPHMQP